MTHVKVTGNRDKVTAVTVNHMNNIYFQWGIISNIVGFTLKIQYSINKDYLESF